MTAYIDEVRDDVWRQLGRTNPIRRAFLGREQCDCIVSTTLFEMLSETLSTTYASADDQSLEMAVERRVRGAFSDLCGFPFGSLLISWAISTIVRMIVLRWWKQNQPEGEG